MEIIALQGINNLWYDVIYLLLKGVVVSNGSTCLVVCADDKKEKILTKRCLVQYFIKDDF